MNHLRLTRAALIVVGVICTPALVSAQTTQHVPLQKTIGQTKAQVVPSLFVLNSRGATLQGGKLTLTGVSLNSVVFADRPVRAAGHDLTSRIVEDWAKGHDNFAQDPPNATVSVFTKDGIGVKDAVVVLKNPKLEGDRLTFDVDVLEGELDGADGAASLFIDIIGRPLTPYRTPAWHGERPIVAPTMQVPPQLQPLEPLPPRPTIIPTTGRPADLTRCRPATDVGGSYIGCRPAVATAPQRLAHSKARLHPGETEAWLATRQSISLPPPAGTPLQN
jgi:hypothetical protein